MTDDHTFKKGGGIIRKTEVIVLTLCLLITAVLYNWNVVGAQEYDPNQSYLDTQIGGTKITATPGACGTGTIVLTWPTISQIDGYRLARNGSDVIYTGSSATYTDTGLTAGSQPMYYLVAYKGGTTSNTAATVRGTAPGNCVTAPPAAPTNLTASYSQVASGVVLNWSASSFTNSNILRRAGGGSFSQVGSVTGTQTTYTDTSNLTPGTVYEYQVVACSSVGCSGPSNTASATTPNSTTQAATTTTTTTTTTTNAPSPATGFSALYYAPVNGIELSWTNPGFVTPTAIIIERRPTGGSFAAIQTLSGSPTTHTDYVSLTPGTTYEYRLRSCSGANNCNYSANNATVTTPAAVTAATTTTTTTSTAAGTATTTTTTGTTVTTATNETGTAPAAPVVSVSTPTGCGTFTVYVSWTAASGASVYDIYRDNVLAIHTTGTTYGDVGLAAGSSHTYRVAARNSYGSTLSSSVSATVPSACATTAITETLTQPQTQPQTQPETQAPPVMIMTDAAPVETRPVQSAQPAVRQVPPVRSAPPSVVEPAPYVAPPPLELAPVTPEQVQFVVTLQTIAESVTASQTSVDAARNALIASVDEHINMVLRATALGGTQPGEEAIRAIRAQLVNTINISFAQGVMPSAADEKRLEAAIKEGFAAIDRAASFDSTTAPGSQGSVTSAIGVLADAVEQAAKSLEVSGAGALYKDTNKDGISDYDSVHIYHLDPIKPSPVTVINGQTLTAGDKVLRGYDPTAKELVALPVQEPTVSVAPETTIYKVEDVKLTTEKQVAISGSALPNSYVTLYIYSTPIVVTVKTDRNGKWQYTVDRELETGEHKIYAASVDNTGKIVAKTVAIPFTRTAEAATLDSVPPLGASSVDRPGLANNRMLLPLIAMSILFIIGALYVIGKDRREVPPTPPASA